MQLPAGQTPYDIIEVRFKNSRKAFYRNSKNLSLQAGDAVVVEASPGHDVGVVSVTGELARIQVKKKAPNLKPMEVRKIHRIATQEDVDKWMKGRALESEVMFSSRTIALKNGLEMKISDVEYQGDLSKATFYYTAEGRVDFRQLIKDMADKFKIRVEMRQIGSRQEAQRLGGIGSCGRELCCSTWLTDFRSVSTSAARYQQLSLNPQKLAGQCGKLKCCLNYELDMYLDAIKSFPTTDTRLQTEKGNAFHVKTDVFKRQMWYVYDGDGGGLTALSPERVREISQMNANGKKPAELRAYVEEVVIREPNYDNVDDQDSLSRFDDKFSKNRKRKKKKKPAGQKDGSPAATAAPATEKQQRGPKPQSQNRPQNPNKQKENRPQANAGEGDNQQPRQQRPQGERQQNRPPRQKRPNPAEGLNPAVQAQAGGQGDEQKTANPNKRRNNRRRPPRQNNSANENPAG